MKASEYIHRTLSKIVSSHRIVVWYDAESVFHEFINKLDFPDCNIVSAQESGLRARRKAEELFQFLDQPNAIYSNKNANLLIYIPHARYTEEERIQDPFEVFAVAGTTFG